MLNEVQGCGTEIDPYNIENVKELQAVKEDLCSHYVLSDDIDASKTKYWSGGFDPIGDSGNPFQGVFDGNGYEIRGLRINRQNEDCIGLFGKNIGIIDNVSLVDIDVTGCSKVGGIVGTNGKSNTGSVTRNSHVTGSVKGYDYVGGIAGMNCGNIVGSCAKTEVKAKRVSGELIGSSLNGKTQICWNIVGNSEPIGVEYQQSSLLLEFKSLNGLSVGNIDLEIAKPNYNIMCDAHDWTVRLVHESDVYYTMAYPKKIEKFVEFHDESVIKVTDRFNRLIDVHKEI